MKRLAGGLPEVCSNAVVHELGDREEVRHDDAAETEPLPEDVGEEPAVGGDRHAVDGVEGGHHRLRSGTDGGFERRDVAVEELGDRDLRPVVVASAFRRTIAHEMLRGRREAALAIAPDPRRGERGREERILSRTLDHAPPSRIARDINHRRKREIDAVLRRLARHHLRRELRQIGPPRRRPRDRHREGDAEGVDGIDGEEEGDLEAGPSGGGLERPEMAGVDHVQHVADAPLLDRLELGLVGKGEGWKVELPDLLRERHAGDQRRDLGLDVRLHGTRRRRGGGGGRMSREGCERGEQEQKDTQ